MSVGEEISSRLRPIPGGVDGRRVGARKPSPSGFLVEHAGQYPLSSRPDQSRVAANHVSCCSPQCGAAEAIAMVRSGQQLPELQPGAAPIRLIKVSATSSASRLELTVEVVRAGGATVGHEMAPALNPFGPNCGGSSPARL
jgi:hypothetical protein